jgi:diguanylate cyclase (GGDEF)-like protein/putative nucleotidyltransferase with HDIG domain
LALWSIDLLLLDQKHYRLPVDQSAMSATLPHELLESLRDLASATTRTDCTTRINAHLERLFPALGAALELEPAAADLRAASANPDDAARITLNARGRRHGQLRLASAGELDDRGRRLLEAFAEHAALALDNARLLEDHDRRAREDPLTGLLNRGEFNELLTTAVARCSGHPTNVLSLAVFDLDHFKDVNDAGGHGAGDRLLRATAATLTAVSRASDAAFRIGGDEFALLLPGCSAEDSAAIAERAADAIGQLEGSAGASWGVATIPTDASTRDGLVAAADAGMYERKGRRSQTASLLRQDARSRLQVASNLATRLTELHEPRQIAQTVVDQLHSAFGYYLAAIHRLDPDGVLRLVAATGRLTEEGIDWLAWEQSIASGVNGRVARTGRRSLVDDTRLDADYLGSGPSLDPGSELSVPIHVGGSVWGVLNLEQLATHSFDEYDVMLAEAVVAQTGAALHRCQLVDAMEHSFSTTLGVLCDALESKDAYTADHAAEVAELAGATAAHLGLPEAQQRSLRYCALLHDIGKLGVRTELLTKPARLTPEEYVEVQEHSLIGFTLLTRIPLLQQIAPLVRAVHERWDGRGYPDGLSGFQIPVEARIVAVCDAWHAMRYDRPYRRALTRSAALSELTTGAGGQFDPDVVSAFISTVEA